MYNAVIIIIIYTRTKMKHLEYQTALTYKQKWGAVALLLLCLLQPPAFSTMDAASAQKC